MRFTGAESTVHGPACPLPGARLAPEPRMIRHHPEPAPAVRRPRLELARKDTPAPPKASSPHTPPSIEAAKARQLVDSWIDTTFISRGDAVEDLVRRIASLLTERDAGGPDADG